MRRDIGPIAPVGGIRQYRRLISTPFLLPSTIHPQRVAMNSFLKRLYRLVTRLALASGQPGIHFLRSAIAFLRRIATHPQVAELFRFIFLGTIVETGRQIAAKIAEFVKAEFPVRDFSYDWVVHYLEHHRVWNESRSFKIVARNATSRPFQLSKNTTGSTDHPVPIYEAATAQSSSLFRWRGYWMSVSKTTAGLTHYDADASGGGTSGDGGALILAVYTRRRDVLDEFVAAAREFYIDTGVLPRKQYNVKMEPSDSLLTAYFEHSDLTHDWMLEYLRSFDVLTDVMDYHVSLKQSHLDAVRFLPAPDSMQRFLFKSPRTGRSTWVQVVIHTGVESWSDSGRMIGGSIYLTLHSSDKEVLVDLINCAKQRYLEHGTSRVIVHLTSNNGQWAKTVTKSRRDLSTLILPSDIKETILTDAQEFLASEKWYNMAGIPHRRDGAPGTGKSSTIHAIIYYISLANPGIDDYTLARLISDTPARCILLLEDIDCAFPSRDNFDDDDDDENQKKDHHGGSARRGLYSIMPRKSAVTLSGLLNVLDSVSSEEGRITFATTNHIANLDAALIRPGRMDVKIKYGLATTEQIERVFTVFFPALNPAEGIDASHPPISSTDLAKYAADFAAAIPTETYSIAQIQGYLLTKKHDPAGAVQGAGDWLIDQQREREALREAKKQWRDEMMRWQLGFTPASRDAEAWQAIVGDIEPPTNPTSTDGNNLSNVEPRKEEDITDILFGDSGATVTDSG
ncbi:p-loop containing nucleoside triphosphate hydrolase protein [Favolaschia claudopus]|uniref:P-loop containing nucleoside triphosphate hydrolase protein n=1 Tax=Favolaschia claudopus TaxID=2862362 RepID=A0AAW0BDS4_9AGAR